MIYHRRKVAAYLCDNWLLVKSVPSAVRMIPEARHEPPYEGAKDMLLVENIVRFSEEANRTLTNDNSVHYWLKINGVSDKMVADSIWAEAKFGM